MSDKKQSSPPQISPYVFPALLAGFGLWCLYDGFFTTDPGMQEHLLFNRIAAGILLPWAVFDFLRTRKREQAERIAKEHTEKPKQ